MEVKKITLRLENEVHQAFKVKCIHDNTNMQEVLTEKVMEYLKEVPEQKQK